MRFAARLAQQDMDAPKDREKVIGAIKVVASQQCINA